MARLSNMPQEAIINGFKGKIDYYYWMGIPCARAWPRSPDRARAPLVQRGFEPFAWAAANWNSLSPEVQQAYRNTAQGSTMSGRDLFIKSFISDYFREGQW